MITYYRAATFTFIVMSEQQNFTLMRNPLFILLALAAFGCSKDDSPQDASYLYGTWIKGTAVGDTIIFYKSGDKNLMKYAASFNPQLPMYATSEYRYENDRLETKGYPGMGTDFRAIQGFAWKRSGFEFELQGSELYPFMASILTKFSYNKVK